MSRVDLGRAFCVTERISSPVRERERKKRGWENKAFSEICCALFEKTTLVEKKRRTFWRDVCRQSFKRKRLWGALGRIARSIPETRDHHGDRARS